MKLSKEKKLRSKRQSLFTSLHQSPQDLFTTRLKNFYLCQLCRTSYHLTVWWSSKMPRIKRLTLILLSTRLKISRKKGSQAEKRRILVSHSLRHSSEILRIGNGLGVIWKTRNSKQWSSLESKTKTSISKNTTTILLIVTLGIGLLIGAYYVINKK